MKIGASGFKSESESSSVVPDSLRLPGQNTGVGSLSLLQQIFLTQKSNRGLLHCRWILYQLSSIREALYKYKNLSLCYETLPGTFGKGDSFMASLWPCLGVQPIRLFYDPAVSIRLR